MNLSNKKLLIQNSYVCVSFYFVAMATAFKTIALPVGFHAVSRNWGTELTPPPLQKFYIGLRCRMPTWKVRPSAYIIVP